jgi:hypothetical protein
MTTTRIATLAAFVFIGVSLAAMFIAGHGSTVQPAPNVCYHNYSGYHGPCESTGERQGEAFMAGGNFLPAYLLYLQGKQPFPTDDIRGAAPKTWQDMLIPQDCMCDKGCC